MEEEFVSIHISDEIDSLYQCVCGSKVFGDYLDVHIQTDRHQRYLRETHPFASNVCEICMNSSAIGDLFTCEVCTQTHCNPCHDKMEKCPFCRTKFPTTQVEMLFYNTVTLHLFYLETSRNHQDMSITVLKESLDKWDFLYAKSKYRELQEKVLYLLQTKEIERVLHYL